jgi:hypothetical protein
VEAAEAVEKWAAAVAVATAGAAAATARKETAVRLKKGKEMAKETN